MNKASKSNNWHHNAKLTERAKYLRKHATKAEVYLWKFGLKSKVMVYSFQRQRPVLHYIAYFMYKDLLLIIECDGATHLLEGAEKKDLKRQSALEAIGFTFLRFDDGMILSNLSLTLSIIEQEVELLAKQKEKSLSTDNHQEGISLE